MFYLLHHLSSYKHSFNWQLSLILFRLIEEGSANVDAMCRSTGATGLIVSSGKRHEPIVRYFLSKGAQPFICDIKGQSPIHFAVANGDQKVLSLLLECEDRSEIVNAELKQNNFKFGPHLDSWIHKHDFHVPNVSGEYFIIRIIYFLNSIITKDAVECKYNMKNILEQNLEIKYNFKTTKYKNILR